MLRFYGSICMAQKGSGGADIICGSNRANHTRSRDFPSTGGYFKRTSQMIELREIAMRNWKNCSAFCLCLAIAQSAFGQTAITDGYGYPITDAYAATILGTPDDL